MTTPNPTRDNLISKWSAFFSDRYKTTFLIVVAIIIAGIFGIFNNQRQDFPQIPSNYITVSTVYVGASAEDVEQSVTIPIEQALGELEGVKSMRSTAQDNVGFTILEMNDVDGVEDSLTKTKELVDQVSLPTGVETEVNLIDIVGPTLVYALASDGVPQEDMLAYAETVKTELLKHSGEIKEITISPENEFEIRVEYDAEKLSDKNISSQEMTAVISSSITALPGGALSPTDGHTLSISVKPATKNLEDLKQLKVRGVALADVASVYRQPVGAEDKNYAGFINADGKAVSTEATYLFVYKKSDGDVIRIADALADAETSLHDDGVIPESVTFAKVFDNSAYVRKQISALISNGVLGLVLILLVLMLFINLRTGIVVALIIPLAFFATLAILYAIGFSINILTLFGLLLVLGILVDNAIVIAEGVTHEIERGKTRLEAVSTTMRHLGPAVTAATATTVVVFIPFASIGGIIGAFLKYIPYTIIIMLVVSFFLAITITPLLARYLLKEETKDQRRARPWHWWQFALVLPAAIRGGQRLIDWLEEIYVKFSQALQASKLKQALAVITVLIMLGGSVGFFASKLPVQQFPEVDSEIITVTLDLPAGTTPEQRNAVIEKTMPKLITTPEFRSYFFLEGQLWLVFSPIEDRADELTIFDIDAKLKEKLTDLEAQQVDMGVAYNNQVQSAGPPEESYDVVIEIKNSDLGTLESITNDLGSYAETLSGVTVVENSFTVHQLKSLAVALDQDRLRDNGIDPLQAAGSVNSIFSKQTIGAMTVRTDGVSDDVVVSYSQESKSSIDDLKEVIVGIKPGLFPTTVELQDVADINEITKLDAIRRLDGSRLSSIRLKVDKNTDAAAIETTLQNWLDADRLSNYGLDPEDVQYGGYTASQDDNYNDLALVFLLAMIAVYLILVYQFNSFVQPGLIMFTIPLALIGVFPGLIALGESINMISGLGIVALVGIVVNDAIVFVDYFNRLRRTKPDWTISEQLVETGRARFKPILSTSITTIFGVLPLTIADPFWRGLGASLVTGLICSTIGTLIIFPILLRWSEAIMRTIKKFCSACANKTKGLVKKTS